MTIGTIIGEMSSAMTRRRAGKSGREMPSAARVPSVVANIVVSTAAIALLAIAVIQRALPKKSSYQRSEYSCTGSVKNGSWEKDSGTMMNSGAIRNRRTATANATTSVRIRRSDGVA